MNPYHILGVVLAVATSMPPSASAQITPVDVVIGDSSTRCLGLEVSPDMKYMVWVQQTTGQAWVCGLNPDTGDLIPTHGRGMAIPNVQPSGNPQWGQDTNGCFIITLNRTTGALVRARPQSDATGTVTSLAISTLATPANASRQFPFAASLPARAESYVLYEQNDAVSGTPDIYWVDLGQPTVENRLTAPADGALPTTLQSLAVTIYRWFPGTTTCTYAYLRGASPLLQMCQFDVAQPAQPPIAISSDIVAHIDDFPTIVFGQRRLIGGINSTATGRYYRVSAGQQEIGILQITPPDSALANPQWATSFEPFVWNGRAYSAFQIIDGNSPLQPVAAEMWLTSLEDALGTVNGSTLRRISGSDAQVVRRDPEYFLGTTKAWIFYYAKSTNEALYSIHRAESGLPNRQTATTLGLTAQGFHGNAMQLQLTGLPGQFGVLQKSDDLAAWADMNSFVFGSNAVAFSDTNANTSSSRFYRFRTP